jgi:hypothetical protein
VEPHATSKRSWHATALATAFAVVTAASCATNDTDLSSSAPSAQRGVRRLTHREYNNVVRDLLGDDSRPADSFGVEVYGNGFDNGSRGLVMLGPEYVAFRNSAETLAARAVQDPKRLIGDCDPMPAPTRCVDAFLSGFALRAFRRPLSTGETTRLRAVYDAGAANGGFLTGLEFMVSAILQSPAFLYREEIGEPDPTLPHGVVRLSAYELASGLSFLLTGTMPDEVLFQAVRDHKLETQEDMRREATRLATTPAGHQTLHAFLQQWLGTDGLSTLTKDAAVYPAFSRDLASSMSTELDLFFDQVMEGRGSLRELFTSPASTIDGRLAAIYGTPAAGDGFARVILDGDERKGVLTRAGFLAAHADVDSSGPILRGVFLLNSILCRPPPPRPPNVPPAPTQADAVKGRMTTRERFDAHLSNRYCHTCHESIDGVGYGFEHFDALGAFRSTENGKPVDASGVLTGTDVDGPFYGVSELAERLASSPQVVDCFVRHAYRFAMGQDEPSVDDGLLMSITQGVTSDSRLTNVFVSLVAQPGFGLRTASEQSR